MFGIEVRLIIEVSFRSIDGIRRKIIIIVVVSYLSKIVSVKVYF